MKKFWKTDGPDAFLKDVSVTILGQIAVMAVSFALNKIMALAVSTEAFAVYNLVRRFAGVLTYVILIAMGIAVPKYLAACREKKDSTAYARYYVASLMIVLAASAVTAFLCLLFRAPIALRIFGVDGYADYMPAILLYAIGTALATYLYSFYRANDDFMRYNGVQVAIQLLLLILAFGFCRRLLVLHYAWSALYLFFAGGILLKKTLRYLPQAALRSPRDLRAPLRELLLYGVPRVPGEFTLFAYNLVPLVIVSNKFSLTESAYFSAAISINATVAPLFTFAGVVLLPLVSRSVVSRKMEGAQDKIHKLFLLYTVLALCAILGTELLPRFVVWVLYSTAYDPAIPIIRILILAVLPNSYYLLYRNPLDAISRFPYNTVSLAVSFAVTCALMLVSTTLLQCAAAFALGKGILGFLSILLWKRCLRRQNGAAPHPAAG